MLGNLLLAVAFQVGPFYEQRPDSDFYAVRPLWSRERDTTDLLWPVYTRHRDWWRFCFFTHYQDYKNDGYQFEIMPLWFNGRTEQGEKYAGFFPFYGRHPHFLLMYDFEFCLWPVWTEYKMPRPSKDGWLTSRAVLFPFFSWRDDGAWGAWPFYGINYQRESVHRYALWPIVTWASYEKDRDTAGAGSSWMVWPLWASVDREREKQTMFIPPLFSWTEINDGWRLRCPYPLVEVERHSDRHRTSIFPFYEHEEQFAYGDGKSYGDIYRFGWRLVEVYPEETRVFPFWTSNKNHLRIWPFYEEMEWQGKTWHGVLALFPITWVDQVDRNWSAFWTFYESVSDEKGTDHSLLWGIIRWRTEND